MAARLPPDIMLFVCEELGNLKEFHTLLNCALAGKSLADSALLWLYRIHAESPIRSAESTEAEVSKNGVTFVAQQARERRTVSKWAFQWRSIILSSLGKTVYPYCLYIRSLELSNLSELFDDPPFASIYNDFFADDMAIFFKTRGTPMKPKRSKRRYAPRLDITAILDMVGESISKYVAESAQTFGGTAALEELSGHIERTALPRWVARLPRLKSLTLWDGAVLNKETADAIRPNCNDFESLDLMLCKGEQADTDLADFFFGLNANSMRLLQMISSNDLGGQTFLALSSHGASLRDLSLRSLQTPALRVLSLLQGCKALQTLTLECIDGSLDLEATQNDTYLEIIAWLTSCVHLKSIRLQNFVNGPAILTSICLEEKIKLEKLELLDYPVVGNRDFHLSLSQQTSLESLYLKGDATGAFRDDNDTLVSSICKLTNLTYLNIIDTSDFFENAEIKLLAAHLPNLEDLTISGYNMDDTIWTALSGLGQLRSLSFQAMTSFTFDGIIRYISDLKPSNAGLDVSIMSASMASRLNPDEEAAIRSVLADKVDGKFQFVMFRDPSESSFTSDSE